MVERSLLTIAGVLVNVMLSRVSEIQLSVSTHYVTIKRINMWELCQLIAQHVTHQKPGCHEETCLHQWMLPYKEI